MGKDAGPAFYCVRPALGYPLTVGRWPLMTIFPRELSQVNEALSALCVAEIWLAAVRETLGFPYRGSYVPVPKYSP